LFLRFIKIITPPIIWESLKKVKNNYKKYYGLNNLDQKIEKYLNYKDGFFVELGANDGISQSNTFYFERHKNWRGLLIEPYPANYLKCLKSRSKDNHIFCNACVSFDYKDRFVELIFSNLMTSSLGLETDIKNTIPHVYLDKKNENKFKFAAVATTLNNLLLQSKAPQKIDFLSLDVEGAEIEVLKGIDHSTFRFRFMLIESRDINKLQNYLKLLGYELIEKLTEHDYLFINKSKKD
jgi:FkbM family methyltransferase